MDAKKLKIFHIVRNDGAGFDEYDSAVVVAHTKEEAVNMLQSKHGTDPYGTWRNYNVTVTEVIPDSPRIVIESFNAG